MKPNEDFPLVHHFNQKMRAAEQLTFGKKLQSLMMFVGFMTDLRNSPLTADTKEENKSILVQHVQHLKWALVSMIKTWRLELRYKQTKHIPSGNHHVFCRNSTVSCSIGQLVNNVSTYSQQKWCMLEMFQYHIGRYWLTIPYQCAKNMSPFFFMCNP